MKKLLTYLTIALSLIVAFGNKVMANPSLPQMTVSLTESDIDIREEDPKGWRMPVAPFTCMIDFTNLSITSDRLPKVLLYELWDETGDIMLISYPNDYDMVTFISSQKGCYQLRLVTERNTYIGYIEL